MSTTPKPKFVVRAGSDTSAVYIFRPAVATPDWGSGNPYGRTAPKWTSDITRAHMWATYETASKHAATAPITATVESVIR